MSIVITDVVLVYICIQHVLVLTVGIAVLLHPGARQQAGRYHGVTQWRHQVVDERLLQFGKLGVGSIHVRRNGHATIRLFISLLDTQLVNLHTIGHSYF